MCVTKPPTTCPTGQILSNGACVTPPPGACPPGQEPVNGVCQPTGVSCPGGFVDASGNCISLTAPAPIGGVCPTGWQIDSAGNCTPAGSETNPYSLYLPANDTAPIDNTAAAAAAAACVAGDFQDLAGNCWPSGVAGWLEASTLIAGTPNYEIVGAAAAAALGLFLLMSRKPAKAVRR